MGLDGTPPSGERSGATRSPVGAGLHTAAHHAPACDQRSCDLAKDTETVTLRVSRAPRGVTAKLGAEAC